MPQLWIQDDGTLTRGVVTSGPRTRSQLSTSQVQALQRLHDQWCTHPPQGRAPATSGHMYEIGLACHSWADQLSGRSDQQFVIPFEQLPMILQDLVTERMDTYQQDIPNGIHGLANAPNLPLQPTASRTRSVAFWVVVSCARSG